MIRRFFLFVLIGFSSFNLFAQDVRLPATPNFNVYDYVMYGGIVGYRMGDYFTTEKALAHGGVEGELPAALVESKPGFAAYSLGLAALEISGSVYLHKHGHKRIARFADTLSVAAGTRTDIKNARVQ
jgi:hypothetical protein